MPLIFAVGGDVSKGRLDVVIFNQSLTELSGSGSYDDTHAGHVRLRDHIRALEIPLISAEIADIQGRKRVDRWLAGSGVALGYDERRAVGALDSMAGVNPLTGAVEARALRRHRCGDGTRFSHPIFLRVFPSAIRSRLAIDIYRARTLGTMLSAAGASTIQLLLTQVHPQLSAAMPLEPPSVLLAS